MFYDDSPLSTLINVGMWGASFWLGDINGRNKAMQEITAQQRDNEIQALRNQIAELKKMMTPPPIPSKES